MSAVFHAWCKGTLEEFQSRQDARESCIGESNVMKSVGSPFQLRGKKVLNVPIMKGDRYIDLEV